ncbi:MAG TPA: SMC family ATPase [Chloroflexia bacterium]|nr:SMC family ATPase [Chloroflexia bacterium]
MIPLRLTLKNFMSYRGQSAPIDFAPIHIACLTGENGAGKSALLTAMTWALWGEAQAHADDEDLITQGETEMGVDLEFGLGDQQYRVLRSRSRKGKTTIGRLSFQVRDPERGWRDISGDNLRHTQRQITERLRMDHETFVNSAFLRQGRADEFTIKNPTERKDILARILGLEAYDVLAERARELGRARESDRRALAVTLQDLDRQIARKSELEQEAAEIAVYLHAAQQTLEGAATDAERLRLLVAALAKDETELANIRARAAQDEVEISKADRAIHDLEANLLRYQEVIAQRASITANYERLQTLRARLGELSELARACRTVEGEIHRLERAIDQGRNMLANEIAMLGRSIAEQGRVAAQHADYLRQLAEARTRLTALLAVDEAWRAAHVALDTLQQQVAGLKGANEKLKEEADGLHAKLKLLNAGIAAAEAAQRQGHAPCPLCGLLLDAAALERVRSSYEQDIAARRQQWKANTRQTDALQHEIAAIQAQIAELEIQLKARPMAEKREAALERDVNAAADAQARMLREQASQQALEARLAAGDYAASERAALQDAQDQLARLAYDPEEHHRVEAEARQLAVYESRWADLRSAQEKLESDTARLASERDRLAMHRARLARERAEETRLTAAIVDLPELRRQAGQQDAIVKHERERCDTLARGQAAKAQELEAVAAAETERGIKAAELVRAATEKGIFDDLARAFGKGGIQAMIIEQVVPELADDANTLLARMTDNRMHLVFETQKQAKSKDSTIETLDIRITDGAGVARKYEMFSGGEAFRINFAVRIALSKLLARRAGAQLQTLIIDEGFGTQDAQGRDRLVQAIRSIQDDFEKILVITHIDDLKDAFAARIDVVKTSGGSLAQVN